MYTGFQGYEALLIGQADGAAAPDAWGVLLQPWLLFLILPLLFYFMVMRPERQRRNEHTAMLDSLKKNDQVITAGGIYGTVVNAVAGSKDIILRIDDSSNTRMRVLRSAVSQVVRQEETATDQAES